MPRDTKGLSLRRLVADLSGLDDADIQDILSELDRTERAKVEALLASYVGVAPLAVRAPVKETPLRINTEGLSPWLVERIHAASPAGEVRPRSLLSAMADRLARRRPRVAAVMTPVAKEALCASAVAVQGHAVPSRRGAPLLGWWKPLARPMSAGAPA